MSTFADRSANPLSSRQVVVTGVGLVTPFGAGREISWSAICNGQSAVRWLAADDLSGTLPSGAQWVGASAPRECLSAANEPVVAMAQRAAREAMTHAGLSELSQWNGCVIGTSKLGLRSFSRFVEQVSNRSGQSTTSELFRSPTPCGSGDSRQVIASPDPQGVGLQDSELLFGTHEYWPNAAARAVANEWNICGPVLCPVAACATGLVSLIRGADLIRSGECDVVLAGSSDASLVPIVLGSFQRLGVMARGFEEPCSACRPFDAERSGFVIGEGAAVLVLEDREHALARGATRLAEFVAGGMASDPSGLTQVDPNGTSLAWLIRDVLRRANVSPTDIDAINLHGTATRTNDVAETRAVRAAFGSAADGIACSSQKGAIGHLLGAAGSVESALAVLSLRDQVVPPTINLRTPDPDCDLDYVPNVARPMPLRNVLKMSLGFGGHVAVGLFRQ